MVLIECDAIIDISDAQKLKAQLIDAISEKKAVEIDASQVERIDTSALQLLLSFINTAAMEKLEVSWKGMSENFKQAVRMLGLGDGLGLK